MTTCPCKDFADAIEEQAEKDKMAAKCAKICDHGINCFINRQLIYNYPEEIFAKRGVMAIEHADFEGTERLGRRARCGNYLDLRPTGSS